MSTGSVASSGAAYRTGSESFGRTFLLEQLAPCLQRLAHDITAGQNHDIEHVVQDRRLR